MNFFGQWTKYAGFFSYLYALPGYTEYTFFTKSNNPSSHHTPPPPPYHPPQKWSARQIVEFPMSHISFLMHHVLYVPVIRNYNISGEMHVLCIRHFVTYAELMQTGKWSLLKIRGLWAMGFSDISGHHSIFRSVSYCQCQSLFTIGDERLQVN